MNDRGGYLTCGLSDVEGYFNFGNIAYGTYQLFPDVAGVPANPMFVTISEEEPTVEDLCLVINTEEIIFSVNENISAYVEGAVLVYPNPARDLATLSIDMKKSSPVSISIFDPSGRLVYNDSQYLEEGANRVSVDVSGLSTGCYQIVLVPEDQVAIPARLLKVK